MPGSPGSARHIPMRINSRGALVSMLTPSPPRRSRRDQENRSPFSTAGQRLVSRIFDGVGRELVETHTEVSTSVIRTHTSIRGARTTAATRARGSTRSRRPTYDHGENFTHRPAHMPPLNRAPTRGVIRIRRGGPRRFLGALGDTPPPPNHAEERDPAGERASRPMPLTHADLWLDGVTPPEGTTDREHQECSVCLQIKSHPVGADADGTVQTLLSRMSAEELYQVAILSEQHYRWVSDSLKASLADRPTYDEMVDGLPPDSLERLSELDARRFGRTVPGSLDPAKEALREDAADLLRRFELDFDEIRLMLRATGAIISGSTVTSLFPTPVHFLPDDVDFFTASGGGYKLVDFLKTGTGYRLSNVETAYNFVAGIGKVWTMVHGVYGFKINIIESMSGNPFDAIMRFHSTCVFGAWTADKIWHGYPSLTVEGRAITTPLLTPLQGGLDVHRTTWRVLKKYIARGFTYEFGEYNDPHVCSENWCCPACRRKTDDLACMSVSFPSWRFPPQGAEYETTWCLGGVGCTQGIETSGSQMARPALATSAINEKA
ncbi:hypothetical protein C8R43DRAFT_960908 [Mycena crocata]|nr:hypothetical protein C8R43DRAFT_960908 [Mycena crocata]